MKLDDFIKLVLMRTPKGVMITFDLTVDERTCVREGASNRITFVVDKSEMKMEAGDEQDTNS